jgi:hypothetical protein
MKDFYDFNKLRKIPNPLQHKIDSGALKLKSPFDIPEEEFQEKIKGLDDYQREYVLERRKQWENRR